MNWITLSLLSAFCLGGYEIARKFSLRTLPAAYALLLSSALSALIMAPQALALEPLPLTQHQWIILKSLIISVSWTAEFIALQRVPLSIGLAVRSTGPLLTTIMAVTLFGERPNTAEWIGIILVLGGYFQFASLARFHKTTNDLRYRWLVVIFGGTILGALSAGIDRHVLKSTTLTPAALQTWFSIYTPLFILLLFPLSRSFRLQGQFIGRKIGWWIVAIVLISLLLLISDRLYFSALHNTGSSLAVVGSLRRGSLIVSVIGGGLLLREKRMGEKAAAITLVALGLIIMKIMGG